MKELRPMPRTLRIPEKARQATRAQKLSKKTFSIFVLIKANPDDFGNFSINGRMKLAEEEWRSIEPLIPKDEYGATRRGNPRDRRDAKCSVSASMTLPQFSSDTRVLVSATLALTEQLWRDGFR